MSDSVAYAGFWRRVVALVIDSFLLGALGFAVSKVFGPELADPENPLAGVNPLPLAINTLVAFLYYVLLESSAWQATLGKRALGMRVTDLEGRRISVGRAIGRYFAKVVSALILAIGFLMVAFTERKQGLHDKLAGTLVMRAA